MTDDESREAQKYIDTINEKIRKKEQKKYAKEWPNKPSGESIYKNLSALNLKNTEIFPLHDLDHPSWEKIFRN